MSNAASLGGHSGIRLFDSDGDPVELSDLTSMLQDFSGKRSFTTVFGEAVVGNRSDSISCQFQYSNSSRDVVSTVSGEREVNSSERWFSHTVLDAAPAGTADIRYNILTLNNKSTYQGKVNPVVFELTIVAFDNSTNRTLAVYGTKGATLTGASAATDVNTADSVTSYQTGGTVTNGSQGPATVQHNGTGQRIDVSNTGIIVYPGESFTFEVVGTQNYTGTFSVSARWRELF